VLCIACHVSCLKSCSDDTLMSCDSCALGWQLAADSAGCQGKCVTYACSQVHRVSHVMLRFSTQGMLLVVVFSFGAACFAFVTYEYLSNYIFVLLRVVIGLIVMCGVPMKFGKLIKIHCRLLIICLSTLFLHNSICSSILV